MKLALLLVLVAPLSGIAQSPATVAAHRAALADAPTDSGLRDGLASARHITAALVERLEGEASAAAKRCAILQAVLIGSVS